MSRVTSLAKAAAETMCTTDVNICATTYTGIIIIIIIIITIIIIIIIIIIITIQYKITLLTKIQILLLYTLWMKRYTIQCKTEEWESLRSEGWVTNRLRKWREVTNYLSVTRVYLAKLITSLSLKHRSVLWMPFSKVL